MLALGGFEPIVILGFNHWTTTQFEKNFLSTMLLYYYICSPGFRWFHKGLVMSTTVLTPWPIFFRLLPLGVATAELSAHWISCRKTPTHTPTADVAYPTHLTCMSLDSGGNQLWRRENMQTPHKKGPSVLWGNSVTHWATSSL